MRDQDRRPKVVIKEVDGLVVYRAMTDPPIEGKAATPEDALAAFKKKMKEAIHSGRLSADDWADLLSYDPWENSSVNMGKIRKIRELEGLGVEDVVSILPSDSFARIAPGCPKAPDWPEQLMEVVPFVDGNIGELFHMDEGSGWRMFDASSRGDIASGWNLEPAMIFQRVSLEDKTTFMPHIMLFLTDDWRCTRPSKQWCDRIPDWATRPRDPNGTPQYQRVLKRALDVASLRGSDEVGPEDLRSALETADEVRTTAPIRWPARFSAAAMSVLDKVLDLCGTREAGTEPGVEHLRVALEEAGR